MEINAVIKIDSEPCTMEQRQVKSSTGRDMDRE